MCLFFRKKITGGTFTQKALMAAQKIIDKKTDDDRKEGKEETEKVIVLLTDGAPTHSFKVKSVKEAPGAIVNYMSEKPDYISAFSDDEPYNGMIADEFNELEGDAAKWSDDEVIDIIKGNGTKLHLESREQGDTVPIASEGVRFTYSNGRYSFRTKKTESNLINHYGRHGAYSYPDNTDNLDYRYRYRDGTVERVSHILDKEYLTDDGKFTVKDNAFATISEAIQIREKGTDIYTIGVGMRDSYVTGMETLDITETLSAVYSNYKYFYNIRIPSLADLSDQVSEEELKNIMINISGSEERYLDAEGAGEIQEQFNSIAREIKKSIPHGEVEDPIGEYFNLDIENPDNIAVKYPWTDVSDPAFDNYDLEITMDSKTEASQMELYNNLRSIGLTDDEAKSHLVKVVYNKVTESLYIDNITLIGAGEWINMRYSVRADTEMTDSEGAEIYEPDVLYPANGRTTLIPNVYAEKKRLLDFYVPSARVNSTDIEVIKTWLGFSEDDKFEVQFDLKRNGEFFNGENEPYRISRNQDTGEWRTEIKNLIKFDSKGKDYEFEVVERTDQASNYITEVHDLTDKSAENLKKFEIKNIRPNMPNTGGRGTGTYKLIGLPLFLGTAAAILRKIWKA